MCCEVPEPADEKVISPGRLRASAIRSFTFFTGIDGCTTSMFGLVASRMIGAKSFIGSKLSFA